MKNERRASLLIEAVKDEDMEVIAKLLRRKSFKLLGSNRKSQTNLQDSEGMSSLHQASLMGNMQILNMFMEIGVNLDQPDAKGMTPLHYASWHNTPDTASLLLQRGAKVDLCNNEGNTPLHIACQHGQVDVISLLIYYHADPTIRNKHGLTPFDVACEYGRLKTVEILMDTGLCKRLLFSHHDDGSKDTVGISPLHLAAKNGHNDVIRLLLESGCDINYKLRHGTPLHDAAATCRVETVKLLLHAGADVHATNNNCQTALDLVKKVTNKNDPAGQNVIQLLQEAQKAIYTKAICDYCAQNEDELSFNYGDVIWVTNQTDDTKWKGVIFGPKYTSRIGYFPQSAVQLIDKKAGMMRLANQRQVKKVGVPMVPDVKYDSSSVSSVPSSTGTNNNIACSGSQILNGDHQNSNCTFVASSNGGDTMKSSRSTFLSHKTHNTSFNTSTMPNSVSAYNFGHFQQQQPKTSSDTFNKPYDSSYYTPRNGTTMSNSPTQHRMSSSSTTSSQTSSGFESMKNGSNSLSNAAVHQMRNFNSPSRSSMHSNGSSSLGSLEKLDEFNCSSSNGRINVAEMIVNGVPEEEILSIWLHSLRYEEYLHLFLNAGYDLETVVRMTPEDLTAIGITKPGHRKRLTAEIRKLNITDSWPSRKPATVNEWLSALSLPQYIHWFVAQGMSNVDQIMQLTWEDFEDIGVKKLGHLKKLVCALKKLKDNQLNRISTPVGSSANGAGVSEVLLINVPSTPRHVGEIRPYYHSPQNQHSLRTFQQNKCQDQQNIWRSEINQVNGYGSPSSLRNHQTNNRIMNRQFSQEQVIYKNDPYSNQTDRGCGTFSLWRDCAGTPTNRSRHDSLPQDGRNQVRYTTTDAILHQPDRPKVIVKPCPNNSSSSLMTKSTSSLENENGNSSCYDVAAKLPLVNNYCRNACVDFEFMQNEQLADAAYVYCDTQCRPAKVSSNLLEPPVQYTSAEYTRYHHHQQQQQPNHRYHIPMYNHQNPHLIVDDRFLPPSTASLSSSVFQLSPQPYFDDTVELSPANSVDDFPPPLRPISCEDQIRNLYFMQQSTDECSDSDSSTKVVKSSIHPQQTKHVTFANCPPSRHNNAMHALNSCSLDNYNNYADNLPFANENVGTIKGKSNVVNGQFCNNRKSISEIFNSETSCTGEKSPDVLGDIGDMLQDLTDQLDALLIQRSSTANHNSCA